ncbi:MAG: hypothetical protein ABL949_11810 [Fimbriimonadaceae bacterium]
MNNAIPGWFFGFALCLMFFNLIILGALVAAMFMLANTLRKLEPRINKLADQMSDEVLPKISSLAAKVEGISDKASTAVGLIGSGVGSASTALGTFTTSGLKKTEKYAPLLGYLMLGMKIFQAISAARSAMSKRKPRQ